MTDKIPSTIEAWDSGPLGKDPSFVKALDSSEEAADRALIDEAFGLKPISIRLEVELLDNLKAIAKRRGLGYQPLVRQVLHRFIESELRQIAIEALSTGENKEVKIEFPTLPKAA